MEYFVQELRKRGHDVKIFIDANQNDRRCYRPQGHTDHFYGFNIDGRMDGSLKTLLENIGFYNALNNKHGPENVHPTREPGSKVIDYVFVSEGLLPHTTVIGMLSHDAIFRVITGRSSWTSMLNLIPVTKRTQCRQNNYANYNWIIQE
jgi:hypothetical protein